ncbi:hypothetical protein [Streptomyces sp. NPDC004135]
MLKQVREYPKGFGNYGSQGNDAFPVVRFTKLGRLLLEQPDETLPAAVPVTSREWCQLFEKWDELTGYTSTMEGLHSSVQEMELAYAKVCSRIDETSRSEFHGDFVAGIGQVVRARSYMVGRFLDDPGAYLAPGAYSLHADRWTAPPLKITLPVDAALADVEKDRFVVYAAQQDEAGRIMVNIMGPREPLRGVRQIDPRAAFLIYTLSSAADVLIGPCPPDVSVLDRQLAESLLGVRTVPLIR